MRNGAQCGGRARPFGKEGFRSGDIRREHAGRIGLGFFGACDPHPSRYGDTHFVRFGRSEDHSKGLGHGRLRLHRQALRGFGPAYRRGSGFTAAPTGTRQSPIPPRPGKPSGRKNPGTAPAKGGLCGAGQKPAVRGLYGSERLERDFCFRSDPRRHRVWARSFPFRAEALERVHRAGGHAQRYGNPEGSQERRRRLYSRIPHRGCPRARSVDPGSRAPPLQPGRHSPSCLRRSFRHHGTEGSPRGPPPGQGRMGTDLRCGPGDDRRHRQGFSHPQSQRGFRPAPGNASRRHHRALLLRDAPRPTRKMPSMPLR